MKQQVEIIITAVYNDKVLLNYDSHHKKYRLPVAEMVFRSSPEELIGSYFQKSYKIVPDEVNIIDVYESETSERLYLIYKIEFTAEQYSGLMAQVGSSVWFDQEKINSGVGIDDASMAILRRFQSKIFQNLNLTEAVSSDDKFVLYTDGGSRGNPGHSGVGYAIYDLAGSIIQEGSEYIGIAVSGVAEYQAVLRGLEASLNLGIKNLEVRVDNLMIAKQMNGIYQVKNRELWPIHERIVKLSTQFEKLKFVHIKREFNQIADRLVNQALDDYLTNA